MQKIKQFFDVVTSVGAAVVIFGAWQKITHRSYADAFLTIGLLTECLIFIGYAVLGILRRNEEKVLTTEKPAPASAPAVLHSVADLDRVSSQLSRLHENLDQLNEVYGGMLRAMRG